MWTAPLAEITASSISSGQLARDEHAVEAGLGLGRRLRPVEPLHQRPRERPLGVASSDVGRRLSAQQEVVPDRQRRVGQRERLAVDLGRRLGDPDVVADRLGHLLHAVGPRQQRHREHRLRRLTVRGLDRAPHQQIERLVGAPELHVGPHGHGVVALEHRVQQLEQRDRLVGGPPLGEVVALEHLGDGRDPRQPEQVLGRHVEPFAVAAQLEPLVGAQDLARLLHVRARVRVDLLAGEDRARGRAPARVADAGRVVAHDQHRRMAGVLELAQLLEDDGVPECDVARSRVEAELDAQRPARGQTRLQRAGGKRFDRVAAQASRRRGGIVHPGQC